MKATKNINIYLIDKKPIRVIDVVQYDTGIQLVFTVKDFPIPPDATATLYVQKPSGKFVYQQKNITIAENTITIDLENQALTEYGRTPYQVTVSSGSDTITTFTGLMIVERSLKDAGAVESRTVIKAFDELTAEKLAELQTNAETVVNAVIATIPDDYTELTEKVNESANAIKGKLSGAIVAADDVSPTEHEMVVEVHSKNRWTTDLTYPTKNIEYDASTQVYTFNDATNATLYTLPKPIPKGTTVTITAYVLSGKVTSLGDGGLAFGGYYKEGTNASWQGYVNIPKMTNTDIGGRVYSQTVETTEDVTHFYAFIYASSAEIHEPLKVKFQYEIGETATEYTPYVDPSTVKVRRCGKSIFSKSSQVVSGVSKPWTSLLVAAVKVPSGNYVASCNFKQRGQDISRVALSVRSYEDYSIAFGDDSSGENSGYLEKSFTVPNSSSGFQLFLYSNQPNEALTTECLFENIQVEFGQKATPYEPYNGTEYIPTSDGVVSGVASVSPNMTILTDTEGVIVECEYNKDTNKVVKKITDALGITI